jgi:hypothetical protein
VRSPVIDPQRRGPAADVDAKRLPRKRLLEDALAEVAGEEQAAGTAAPKAARKRSWGMPMSWASSITTKSKAGRAAPETCAARRV